MSDPPAGEGPVPAGRLAGLPRWERLAWGCTLGLVGLGLAGLLGSYASGNVSGDPVVFASLAALAGGFTVAWILAWLHYPRAEALAEELAVAAFVAAAPASGIGLSARWYERHIPGGFDAIQPDLHLPVAGLVAGSTAAVVFMVMLSVRLQRPVPPSRRTRLARDHLGEDDLRLAAHLGDDASREALRGPFRWDPDDDDALVPGEDPAAPPDPLRWTRGLATFGDLVGYKACLALLDLLPEAEGEDWERARTTAEAYVACPCQAHLEAARAGRGGDPAQAVDEEHESEAERAEDLALALAQGDPVPFARAILDAGGEPELVREAVAAALLPWVLGEAASPSPPAPAGSDPASP